MFQLLIDLSFYKQPCQLEIAKIKITGGGESGTPLYRFKIQAAGACHHPGSNPNKAPTVWFELSNTPFGFKGFSHKSVYTTVGSTPADTPLGSYFHFQDIGLPYGIIRKIGYIFKHLLHRPINYDAVFKLHGPPVLFAGSYRWRLTMNDKAGRHNFQENRLYS
jgi:hypothetical protein